MSFVVAKIVCRGCYVVLDAEDQYCRQCGTKCGTDPAAAPADDEMIPATVVPEKTATTRPSKPATDNPWVVLGLLFLVLGPLGLPMLWRSRAFSTWSKLAISVALLGVIAAAIGLAWYMLAIAIAPLRELTNLKP